ncbi:T9SS type A sorting domain-containing protein [Chryseobacterium scophthalmum]|uniref:T9SS type A sorting domain-containing protein n=1 Tax=Chryseobacterium scophthalmum TaxID=59733 RepID=UPI003CFF2B9A
MKNNQHKKRSISSHFYKINRFVYIAIFISCLSFAQDKKASEIYYTPNGMFDNVIDNHGNAFKLSEIEIAKSQSTETGKTILNSQSFTSGIFELYFENGSGMETVGNSVHDQRRAIILQAFLDISNFINTPLKNAGNTNKVRIWIRSPVGVGLQVNIGSTSSAYYSFPTLSSGINNQGIDIGGILDNEIWKTIHTGVDSYANTVLPIVNTNIADGFYHGWACFNFSGTVNWNLDYNKYNSATAYPVNYIDLYSTVIHEITHVLGFNSLINYYGNSAFYNNPGNYYTRYDKNLKTSSDVPLIINSPLTGGQMYGFNYNSAVSGPVLYPSCTVFPPEFNGNSGTFNCSTSLKYVGNVTVPVYTPSCFEKGSLSHFEDACYNGNSNDQYFMMSDKASSLFAKRTLTSEERQVLCDIGYSVGGTFGDTSNFTFKDYGAATCAGVTIGGVNDGFLNGVYAYQGNIGTNIIVDGILNNDYTSGLSSNLSFEFVQDVYDPDAIISGITPTSFTFKSYVSGVHVLRYVPFDNITGQRGNITYIYVNVLNNCLNFTQSDLVKNGNFEEHNYAPSYTSQIYKSCGWQCTSYFPSPDYFNSDSAYPHVSIPSNIFGTQADKVPGNHAYAGMYISRNRPNLLQNVYSESLKTELTGSLQPNTKYQLSFDVSIADNHQFNAIKFQAFITDTNLELTTGGIIPNANITSDKVFLTNPSFSGTSSLTEWETITFTFTTGNNPNLKYLYIGGLNNVQFQNNNGPDVYYFIDNVSLVPFSQLGLSESNFENDDVEIFPNPTNSIVNIKNSKSSIKSIELYDTAGRILKAEKVNKKEIQIDISNYQIGTYLIKVITSNGDVVKKIIKY